MFEHEGCAMEPAEPTLPIALAAEALRRRCQLPGFPAVPAGEAAATVEEFGHARAIEAIDMASAMAAPGYNMFVIGPNGTAMRQIVERRL
ncbi:MAG: hypothetical protein AAFV62_14490, partial [Pseudomonadota bacterium]